MILAALASLALSASPEEVSAAEAALASGDAHYARRAEGAHGGIADPVHVDRAIADYRRALALEPLSYEARLRLLRAFFFRGGFCDMDPREQVKLFDEAKKLAEDTVRLLDADVHRVRGRLRADAARTIAPAAERSEEHTSELQSRPQLVCRLMPEKKKHTSITPLVFKKKKKKKAIKIIHKQTN